MKILISFIIFLLSSTVFALDCKEGTYKVEGHKRSAYYKKDGTFVSGTNVASYCRHYRDDGPLKEQFLEKKPKRWPHKKENFKKCTKEKEEKIQNILSTLPKILTNVGKLQIYCPSKSEIQNNPATSAPTEKIIALYDLSFKMDTKKVLIHELAHILWERMSNEEKLSYLAVSKWDIDFQKNVYITKRTKFSADDGVSGPDEDFSNNIEYFLVEYSKFNKDFKEISVWISNFLKENK